MEVVAHPNEKILAIERKDSTDRTLLIANLDTIAQSALVNVAGGSWRKVLDSAEEKWRGPGTLLAQELDGRECGPVRLAPRSFGLFHYQGAAR
jgi:maltooligosyltrehalose trehalohydrolase